MQLFPTKGKSAHVQWHFHFLQVFLHIQELRIFPLDLTHPNTVTMTLHCDIILGKTGIGAATNPQQPWKQPPSYVPPFLQLSHQKVSWHYWPPYPLGTIKASQVVVLNENSVVVTQRKTHVNSMILILKLNLTWLRNIYIKSGLR